jgi:hypothetical protein
MALTSNTTAAAKLPTGKSRTTNNPLRRANGNTAQGRRVRDLYRGYMIALGSPNDPVTAALVLAAAEQVVIAENARRDHLAGIADLDSVIRAENMSARALRRLGLNKPVQPPKEDFAAMMQRLATPQRASTEASAVGGADVAADSDQRISGHALQSDGGVA